MIDAIRGCVHEVLRNKGESDEVSDASALLTTGVLDSMDVLEIISFLEERFGLDLAAEPFDPGAFDTIQGIADFCKQLQR